jgi:DNA-3-methyladenine glycosylase I
MPKPPTTLQRCAWANTDPIYAEYHDQEWGVPVHDERRWFEMLTLEGFQAGLSWLTILRKREAFRQAFDQFDFRKIAAYTNADMERLMKNQGIVRNRLKIAATVSNAKAFLEVQREFGSFDAYMWTFTGGSTLRPRRRAKTFAELPTESAESRAMSRDLRRRGFKFVGPTICYAHMQACGMVDDHLAGCFRIEEIS